jgi:ribosomal protein S27AE
MNDNSNANDTCPNCGANEFEQGWLQTVRHNDSFCYYPSDGKAGGVGITTRRCLSCGHLDMFAITGEQ